MQFLDLNEISASDEWECAIMTAPRPYLRLVNRDGSVYRLDLKKAVSSISMEECVMVPTKDQVAYSLREMASILRASADIFSALAGEINE